MVPACYDALKILGHLHPIMPTKVESTVKHFKEAAQRKPEDLAIWEMLGELLSPTDPAGRGQG